MNTDLPSVSAWEFGGILRHVPQDQAWALLFGSAAVAGLLVFLSYHTTVVRLRWIPRLVLGLVRFCGIALVLLCLANPLRVERTTVQPPPVPPRPEKAPPSGVLAVVVDRSDSMTAVDNRNRSRLDDALATWRRFEPLATAAHAEVRYYSVAEKLSSHASLEEATAKGEATGSTRLYANLATLLEKPEGDRPRAIVVLTDGLDLSGESDARFREAALAAGVPVHFIVGNNRERPEPYVRVREFSAPGEVLRATEFKVTVSFEAFSREDRTVPFSLRQGDREIERGAVQLKSGPNVASWSCRVPSGEPGPLELALKLRDGETEQVAARSYTAVVPRRRASVLLYQGALDWSFRYVASALRTDPSFEMLAVMNPALGVKFGSNAAPGAPMLGQLTSNVEELKAVDCIVLARVYPHQFSLEQQQALVEYVRGGGTVLFVNPYPDAIAEFNSSLLSDLSPVFLDNPSEAKASGASGAEKRSKAIPFMVTADQRTKDNDTVIIPLTDFALTPAGRESPIFANGSGANSGRLTPRFLEYVPATRLRPGAEVLATHPTARDPRTGLPHVLLATQTFGRGRTAILTTDCLWRWKLKEPSDSRSVEMFWQQLLLAIGGAREHEPIRFVNTPAQVRVGELAPLFIAGVDRNTPPEVLMQLPNKRGARLQPIATDDPSRPWRVDWRAVQAGTWEFGAKVEGKRPAFAFIAVVPETTGELARTAPAVEQLRELATTTGGLLLTDRAPLSWRADERDIPEKALEPIVTETRHLLWNNWLMLSLVLGAFAVELILRRVWQLL